MRANTLFFADFTLGLVRVPSGKWRGKTRRVECAAVERKEHKDGLVMGRRAFRTFEINRPVFYEEEFEVDPLEETTSDGTRFVWEVVGLWRDGAGSNG